jgi:micrococcal nuclease
MPRRRIDVLPVLLGLLLAAVVAGVWPFCESRSDVVAPAGAPVEGVCTYVYDGDTIEVTGVGKVRLIGIDAFDDHNAEKAAAQAARYGLSRRQVRDLAARGTDRAIEALKGRRLVLEPGYEPTDDYGRALAYVRIAGEGGAGPDFNLSMIETGLAAAFRAFDHPRLAAYLAAEESARQEGRGMWADARLRP